MKIHQYAHFVVGSEAFDPDQITAVLGIKPSSVSWEGSRSSKPLIPRHNVWRYRAAGTGVLDELVRELLGVFEPVKAGLQELTACDASWIGISFMRSFDDPDGVDEDEGAPDLPDNLVRLSGQHQLLGFHLDTELMARLVALECSLDFDEYG